jgi:hypothetical protein
VILGDYSSIQSNLGEKVNILGAVIIGHYNKKIPYEHVSNSTWLP